ncbi:hypothetical protein [Stenotrophomonas lacuserhaii]|jgi:hypothetical protein|uniref:hypothetical protein n=1 Tax=Stenotrophomonas lacuserhaii TaxID=2760084 RepID=UPI0032EEBD62
MVSIILTIVGVIGIGLVIRSIFFDYSSSAIAIARHDLFRQRDRLFDLADSGVLRFDSRPYIAVRALINGYIQYAHRLTLSQILITKLVMTVSKHRTKSVDWKKELSALPKPAREQVNEVLHEAIVTMLRLMITRSPVLSALFILFVGVRVCSHVSKRVAERLRASKVQDLTASEAAYEDVLAQKPGRTFAFVVASEARRVNQGQFPFALQAA